MKSPEAGREEGGRGGENAPPPPPALGPVDGARRQKEGARVGLLAQRVAFGGVLALVVVAVLFVVIPHRPRNALSDPAGLALAAGIGLVLLLELVALGLGLSALRQRGAALGVLVAGLILLAAAAVAGTAFVVR